MMRYRDCDRWSYALRAWGREPSLSLAELPTLELERIEPIRFTRFVRDLESAVTMALVGWQDDLDIALEKARDDVELRRHLRPVRARLDLRHRILLHPGLPKIVRDEIRDITAPIPEQAQRELLEGLRRHADESTLETTALQRMVDYAELCPLTELMPQPATGRSVMKALEDDYEWAVRGCTGFDPTEGGRFPERGRGSKFLD